LKISHPINAGCEPCSDTSLISRSSKSDSLGKTCSPSSHSLRANSSSSTSDNLHSAGFATAKVYEHLSKVVCITESGMLNQLKAQEAAELQEQNKEREKDRGRKKD